MPPLHGGAACAPRRLRRLPPPRAGDLRRGAAARRGAVARARQPRRYGMGPRGEQPRRSGCRRGRALRHTGHSLQFPHLARRGDRRPEPPRRGADAKTGRSDALTEKIDNTLKYNGVTLCGSSLYLFLLKILRKKFAGSDFSPYICIAIRHRSLIE